ncbi:MAG: hypothetical protein M1546_20260 [Chloroflexi bacterium]|nr:hypothetical protein [Chloroflexota bacterium]
MLDDFIQHALAQIDDLAELKVSLVALRLLELKESDTASVTARELATHPALRDGLGFAPQITLDSALQRATARGTLLRTNAESLGEPRYFLNNEASRRTIEAVELAEARRVAAKSTTTHLATRETLAAAMREIEWLEAIDAYPASPADEQLVEEWLAQGYTNDEIMRAVRAALSAPRPKGTPVRTLESCVTLLTANSPANPSAYYRIVVNRTDARTEPAPDEIIAFRELAGRWPNGHEFNLVQAAAGIFGARPAIEAMKRLIVQQHADVDALIPLLSEQEEAELALVRSRIIPDLMLRELIQLYELTFGLPPTSRIAQDIGTLASEINDLGVWRAAFQYAMSQNKRDWAYVRRLLLNPSPALFEPQPVNETAHFAFNEYKRRVSRVLDPSVAREINDVAQHVTDQSRWTYAFDRAASANALNWNYIKKVLTAPPDEKASEVKDARRKHVPGTRQRGVTRRPQVEESTEAEREAARERARQRIAERAKRRATLNGDDANRE